MQPSLRAPTRREQQRDQTRERLFQQALAEFRASGFGRASVARIAQRAGVSRPSFYFHYPTKEHVLLELQWRLERAIVDRLHAAADLRGALEALIDGLIEAEAEVADPELFRDMLSIYARRPQGLELDEQPFPLVFELRRRFADAAQLGQLRDGLEPDQAARLFLTGMFGYLVGAPAGVELRGADLRVLMGLFLNESA